MKKNKGIVKTIIIMLLIAFVIVGGYYYVSNKKANEIVEPEYVQTEMEKLLNKNLDNDYPTTAREVLKFYSRIVLSLYNSDVKDEQVEDLIDQVRKCYSKELLNETTREEQIQKTKEEIEFYKNNKMIITTYQIEKPSSVIAYKQEEIEYNSMIVVYILKQNKKQGRIYERFLFCFEDSKWKIVGWKGVDGAEMDLY